MPTFTPNNQLFGLDVTIATWTAIAPGEISNIMEAATVIILSNDECKNKCQIFGNQNVEIPERMLCTLADPYVVLTSVSIS
jgi:hypothetical protein